MKEVGEGDGIIKRTKIWRHIVRELDESEERMKTKYEYWRTYENGNGTYELRMYNV